MKKQEGINQRNEKSQKEIKELRKREYLNKLFNFALDNNSDDFHIWIEYMGHVDGISIRVAQVGWVKDEDVDYSVFFIFPTKKNSKQNRSLKNLLN